MDSIRVMIVAVVLASTVFATNYTWVPTSGTGSFQTVSNWTPSTGVPGSADNALFSTAGTYGVSFADYVTNANTTVGADVTFDLGGYTWQLTNASPLAFTGSGIARFGGGTLELAQTNTASFPGPNPYPGTNQKLILNSGTSTFRGIIGAATGGTLEINEGTHSLMSGLSLSAAPAGGVSFRMTGGTATVDNISYADARTVLNTSYAKMSLEGGTFVAKKTVDVYGGGVIDVYTNASLTTLITYNFARDGGYKSSMNIYGGTVSNVGGISVGMTIGGQQPKASTGLVYLADGVLHSGNITLGTQSNSVGMIRQSGGMFRMIGTLTLGAGQRTLGVYTQEGGTAWCSAISVGVGPGAVGEIDLTGGTLATPNAFAIGNGGASVGRVFQSGGGLIVSNNFSVGCVAGAYGVYSNTGGRAWCNQLRVGAAAGATGEVFLAGGTLATSGTGPSYIGEVAGASARMLQSGGELIISNALAVGNATGASGTYTNTGGSVWLSGTLYVGNNAGTLGRMFFNGSSLDARGGIFVGNFGYSTGELALAGGLLPMTNANLSVGNSAYSMGKLDIRGGTNLFNNIQVGNLGSALVRVTGGYTYTTNRLIVGAFVSSTSRLELTGGVLSTPIIDGRDPAATNAAGGYSEVLFDGGTLQHSVDNDPTWMPAAFVSTFAKATLTGRGAVIDSNGGTIAIPQALLNEVGYAGSFTKKGAGKLSLTSGANAFTGRVAVEQGELATAGAGNVYLTGGVSVSPGAVLNLSAGTVSDALTASGTVSRIDGALLLKAGGALTNGLGAALGGSGVVTGKVVFASGSAWAHDKANDAGPLQVTAGAVFQSGVTVSLTGYTAQDLAAGIPLVQAVSTGTIQVSGRLPVTLDGASHSTWWTNLSADGKTLTARVIPFGTLIKVL